jgi:hypothetical protein
MVEHDPGRIAQMLNESAKAVRDAVKSKVEAGREMNLHYDHPILPLQHMLQRASKHVLTVLRSRRVGLLKQSLAEKTPP